MTITKRNTKGSSLTYAEMDENIRDLYEDTTLDRVVGNGATTTTPVNLTRINFPAYQDDYAFIDTTVDGTSTSLDFTVGDDDGDSFKWRFNHYADGAGTPVNYMTLRADQTNDDRNTGVLDVTGTINTDGLTVNNDFAEIISTKADEHASPILSLYRNSASPAINERIGGIRMFGENASGEKVFYAGIDGMTGSSVADGAHVGALRFYLADGSDSGSAVTDVSADVTTDEDPIMTLYKYGLVMTAGNDIFLATKDDVIEWKDTGSHDQKLQGRQSENSGGDSLVSMPDGTGTLSLDGFNQTAYRTGEVIEIITGYADGSTISGQATTAGVARNFALEDVTAAQELTTSYAKINGTLVTYLPPVGTKTIEIEYGIFVGHGADSTCVMHHKLSVGGTYVTNTRMTHRDDSAMNKYVVLKSILTVDGSGDVAAGNVDSWSSAIALQLDGREYGASSEAKLHITRYYDGTESAGSQVVIPPSVKITAIG